MYVVATVNAGSIKNAITVPDAAVLRDNENQPFVYASFPTISLADVRSRWAKARQDQRRSPADSKLAIV